jgi:hypothetical protein
MAKLVQRYPKRKDPSPPNTIKLKGPAPSRKLVRQMVRVQKGLGKIPKKARFVKLD